MTDLVENDPSLIFFPFITLVPQINLCDQKHLNLCDSTYCIITSCNKSRNKNDVDINDS